MDLSKMGETYCDFRQDIKDQQDLDQLIAYFNNNGIAQPETFSYFDDPNTVLIIENALLEGRRVFVYPVVGPSSGKIIRENCVAFIAISPKANSES